MRRTGSVRMNILFVSLGCDKNLADTELMMELLREKGYTFTDDEARADIVVVNTCCFIGDAKEESINTLLEFGRLKKEGRLQVLAAAGCLAQRYREEIRREIPEVDVLVGTTAMDEIVSAVENALENRRTDHFRELDRPPVVSRRRVITTGGHFAYLKIAEGCNKRCSYCIIPRVRGSYRSVPMEQLVSQAEYLAENGVKELILAAQETTLYGVDLYGKKMLPQLLGRLARVEGIRWIRLLYCYPEEIYEELIRTIRDEPKICHYLDLPIQHASDRILKRMGRRTTRQDLQKMIGRLREEIPDICLRTTLITGFPQETEEEHEELLDFVDEMEFDRLGVFPYSPEEDTPAACMEGQIPEEIKEARRDELMELQQDISFEKAEAMIGKELWCMVEGKVAEEYAYVARTYKDAPEVDGYIFIQTMAELMSGDFVKVHVTGADEYDLIGEIADEFTE